MFFINADPQWWSCVAERRAVAGRCYHRHRWRAGKYAKTLYCRAQTQPIEADEVNSEKRCYRDSHMKSACIFLERSESTRSSGVFSNPHFP